METAGTTGRSPEDPDRMFVNCRCGFGDLPKFGVQASILVVLRAAAQQRWVAK
jgi:hypothetical protein